MGHRLDFDFYHCVLKFFLFISLGEREKKENKLFLAVHPLKKIWEVVKLLYVFLRT